MMSEAEHQGKVWAGPCSHLAMLAGEIPVVRPPATDQLVLRLQASEAWPSEESQDGSPTHIEQAARSNNLKSTIQVEWQRQ